MKKNALLFLLCLTHILAQAQLTVSTNGRHLLKNAKLFFWLGDTAWVLFHRLIREKTDRYLKCRSEPVFIMIQAAVLAKFDGLLMANAYGETPLLKDAPQNPTRNISNTLLIPLTKRLNAEQYCAVNLRR